MLRQPRRLALLVYLALQPKGACVSRDSVYPVFWPEANRRSAQSALRQAMAFLRSHLAADVLITAGRDRVGVDHDKLWCDAVHFQECARAGYPREALEVYRGDLLSGFSVSGGYAFEEWIESRRTRLRSMANEAAWALAVEAESLGEEARAAFWGKRALSHASFSEGENRRLIQLLDRVGDRAGALRVYRGLVERLREDFDVAPAPETKELIASIRGRGGGDAGISPPETGDSVSGRRTGRGRRNGADRRVRSAIPFAGPERRASGERRRRRERRSGNDRRREV